ncbi:histidine kinase [Eubacteriaceae bacterium ES3]|nr:histidine kinase [Eubacteriaceae bacterium ES3]
MDKIILFICCLALFASTVEMVYKIVPVLIAVIFSAALGYVDKKKAAVGIYIFFTVASFFYRELIYFLPLIAYDIMSGETSWFLFLGLLPYLTGFSGLPITGLVLIPLFMGLGYFLKRRTIMLETIKTDYYKLRDNTKETALQLENKNRQLLEKQDYELNLATLAERNRIARDIHDNVGHLLSRSILQTGALLATTKDQGAKEGLTKIKETLTEAMDSIRNSVHDLHEESFDLEVEIQSLLNQFTFCPVTFEYDILDNPSKEIKYCFVSVVKEALSNVIRHSNGNLVKVRVREHPGFYQLVFWDNGKVEKMGQGIGLENIEDRVKKLKGNVNFGMSDGFRIFISIPKEFEE